MEKNISGRWFISSTKYGPFIHARLTAGEENSGKLITEIRQKAKQVAENNGLIYVIIGWPARNKLPGYSFTFWSYLALIVTEPSLSGIHDMERVIQVARHFGIKVACALNNLTLM
jgi:MinD superfamily P-loop ATPase